MRSLIVTVVLSAVLLAPNGAGAFDESKYPDWKGQWRRAEPGPPRYDPSKPVGLRQQAPLNEEYKAVHAASIADPATRGPGKHPDSHRLSPRLPPVIQRLEPLEN